MLTPDWPAPHNVKAVCSTRSGGCSTGQYQSLNLGAHVGDNALAVSRNRQLFQNWAKMPGPPVWLNQTHSTDCITLVSEMHPGCDADASFSNQPGLVCTVMTADCLPVLICNEAGTEIAAVHAGWRGLCDGVIENTMRLFSKPSGCMAWLGPAISQPVFEVGAEVRAAFIQQDPQAASAFIAGKQDKWLADLYLLARQRLAHSGLTMVYGGQYCTYQQPADFFSYRRDGLTGRMAAAIWLE
ncbi:peptidoglycan editing factor PgeF [Arsukibacterium indicum]|uniref:Purine nucleoside phosphorylase n=1 Tax=Arsukibacterium indicum TaxID=2848612 RepID=A0ABS6MJ73_9GAMM|nr:peptidoglycan editing factor PgeF [Arsukibacterium indicum]MBV2128870.1 peptidoglycan editing factor PgeF [Arsukibacterium indicum]